MSATDDLDATLLELDSEIERTLAALSPTQRRRALAIVSGKGASEIAVAEGVSRQSVHETLAAPAVRDSIAEMIARSSTISHHFNADGEEEKTVVSLSVKAVEVLGGLLVATKFVAHGAALTEVPDNHVRMTAALRILELSQPPPSRGSEIVEERAESLTRRRVKAGS